MDKPSQEQIRELCNMEYLDENGEWKPLSLKNIKTNVNLINAAPDMYEALKAIATCPSNNYESWAKACKQATEALNKAEGK